MTSSKIYGFHVSSPVSGVLALLPVLVPAIERGFISLSTVEYGYSQLCLSPDVGVLLARKIERALEP